MGRRENWLMQSGSVYGVMRKINARERKWANITPIPKWNILKGDTVRVRAGQDRGKEGKVLEIIRSRNAVRVEGLRVGIRRARGMQAAMRVIHYKKERLIPYSQVAVVDPVTKKPTRVIRRRDTSGKVVRVAKSGAIIENRSVPPPRPKKVNAATDTKPEDVLAVTYVPNQYPMPSKSMMVAKKRELKAMIALEQEKERLRLKKAKLEQQSALSQRNAVQMSIHRDVQAARSAASSATTQ